MMYSDFPAPFFLTSVDPQFWQRRMIFGIFPFHQFGTLEHPITQVTDRFGICPQDELRDVGVIVVPDLPPQRVGGFQHRQRIAKFLLIGLNDEHAAVGSVFQLPAPFMLPIPVEHADR